MESFYSIQGEGFYQGEAAHFIRLAGCDVGCHWCDVKESWDISHHPVVSINKIIESLADQPTDKVIVTGGEPLIHNLDYLCKRLHELSLNTHLETSGAYPISGNWDWICLSPKKFKKPIPAVCKKADELKVVIYNRSDFQWAESFVPTVSENCKLYLQPEWSRREEMSPLIIDYIKQHPEWSVSLQIHKYLQVP